MASSTWGVAQACAKRLLIGEAAAWLCRQRQSTKPRNRLCTIHKRIKDCGRMGYGFKDINLFPKASIRQEKVPKVLVENAPVEST